MELLEFLHELGLSNQFEAFSEHGIDSLGSLRQLALDPSEAKSFEIVCPLLGHRIKIKRKLNILSEEERSCDAQPEESDTNSSFVSVQTYTPENVLILDTSLPSTSTATILDPSRIENLQPCKKIKLIFNLKSLLEETRVGKAILAIYAAKKELDSQTQGYLCDIIVSHFLNQEPIQKLVNDDFEFLSKEVVNVFPNEVAAVYYTPPIRKLDSREKKAGISRGKLVDKYRNKLTFLRKAGLLPSTKSASNTSSDVEDKNLHSDDALEATNTETSDVLWLQNNVDPWDEVQLRWEKTYNYRETLFKKDIELKDILQKFPIITNSLGHSLIGIDFKKKFPDSYEKVYYNFEKVFHQLLVNRKNCLSQSDRLLLEILESGSLSADSKHYLMLNLICSLLPPRSSIKKSKTQWQPTAEEVRDGLVVHAKVPAMY